MVLDGVSLVLVASVWFSVSTLLIKALGPDIPVVWVAFIRNVLALMFLAGLMRAKRLAYWSPNWFRLILRGVFGVSAMLCFFWCLPRMPLASCMLLAHASPLYSAVLGTLFMGERLDLRSKGFIGLAAIGVYVTLRPTETALTLPYAAAFAAGILSGLAYATIRSLSHEEHPLRILFFFALVGTLAFLPGVLRSPFRPDSLQWLMMAGIAAATTVGQIFLTLGIGRAPVSKASFGTLSMIVINIAAGWAFWGEVPDGWTWAGCVLVLGGILGLVSGLRRKLIVTVSG